jgi:type I restriction enzyme, S subunit
MSFATVNIGSIIDIKKGKKPLSLFDCEQENSIRFIQIDDLRNDNNLKFTCDPNGVMANETDVIIAWDGANAGTVGYGLNGYIGSTLALLRPKMEVFTPYVAKFLQSKFNLLRDSTFGATIPHVHKGKLCDLQIPLPPLPEQKRIAAILDKAEEIKRKREESLKLADEFLKSVFVDMFGDPVTNPKGWDVEICANCADILSGYAFQSQQYTANPDHIKLCGGLIIMPEGISWKDCNYWDPANTNGLDRFFLKDQDIVIAMDRPWISTGFKIGKVDKKHLPALLVQRTTRIRATKVQQDYLYSLLKHHAFERHCQPTETTVPHISIKDINTFPVMLPPLKMQNEFCEIVSNIVKCNQNMAEQFDKAVHLFGSLTDNAFKGQL